MTMNSIHVFLKNVPLGRDELTRITGKVFHQVVCNCIHVHCPLTTTEAVVISHTLLISSLITVID